MDISIWNFPTKIHYGAGVAASVPALCNELGVSRPLFVTDAGLASVTFVNELLQYCRQQGLQVQLFSEVQGNPNGSHVTQGVRTYQQHGCNGVVALGGGSAIDVGKAIALTCGTTESLWELGGASYNWRWMPKETIAPLIAIPTTAGTGSEVGSSAVIIDERNEEKNKILISHPQLIPAFAVLDPKLTVALPRLLTAATGMDALTHCFEAYCHYDFHPICEGIALEGMRLIKESLLCACQDGANIDVRGRMLVAASMGAIAFQKDLGGIHALAHPLGSMYNIHHGLANAIIMPYIMQINRDAIRDKMILLGRVLNLSDPGFNAVMQWVLDFREKIGIPHSLADAGIPEIDAIEVGERAASDLCADGNPIRLTAEQYQQVFLNACRGVIE